jgi:hypothetical protein
MSGTWWGDYEIAAGACGRWRIGPMTVWIARLHNEWRIAHASEPRGSDDEVAVEVPLREPVDLSPMDTLIRFGISGTSPDLRIEPRLADRAVVSSPDRPFSIPAGQDIAIFVGTPLWLSLAVGTPASELLQLPIQRPSDTWFGSPTSGELCYASRTACRLRLDELPARPHRALTTVLLRNRADTPLPLERIRLPVMHLSLYASADGFLWTEDVELERAADADLLPLAIHPGAPRSAPAAILVAPPRRKNHGNMMFRAFSSLFSSVGS